MPPPLPPPAPHRPLPPSIWATCLVTAVLTVLPMMGFDGWPFNHERVAFFMRAEAFRRAFEAGDFFPLWTPFCHNGHGSPWPFFYHRLFTTVSGGLAWMGGSTYRGVEFALILLLFVGAMGAAAAARRLGASTPFQMLAALLLCVSPYAFFDWLIRGAMAEFAAMMVFPWLVWACLRLFSEGRGGWAAGLFFVALFYAHTVMFLFALPSFALALGLGMRRWGGRPMLTAALQAALPVILLCAPYALLLVRLGRAFNTEALGIYTPESQFLPFWRYLWDTEFQWGGTDWEASTPEFGPAMLGGLVLLIPVAYRARGKLQDRGLPLLWLALVFGLYTLFQLPVSIPLYRAVPFALLLQFPWRLVGFLTPILVLVLVVLLEVCASEGRGLRALALLVGVLAIAEGGGRWWRATHPHAHAWSRTQIEPYLRELDGPWSAGEYLPLGLEQVGIAPRTPFLANEGCAGLAAEPARALEGPYPFVDLTLSISTSQNCVVSFNQYVTPFLSARSDGPVRFAITKAGTLAIQVPPGEHVVELRRRGVWELFARELLAALF